jgi:hypothetical protein
MSARDYARSVAGALARTDPDWSAPDGEPEVQWAVRYDSDSGRPHVGIEESEESAREQAAREPYPGTRRTVVRRMVIYGEWENDR